MIYSMLILSRTVFYRDIWTNPLSDIMGGWGLYDVDGNLTTEAIENLMLFIPFTVLLLWAFRKELLGEKPEIRKTLWIATKTVGIFLLESSFFNCCSTLARSKYRTWCTTRWAEPLAARCTM